jgi:hypothetical protein
LDHPIVQLAGDPLTIVKHCDALQLSLRSSIFESD